MSFPNATPLSHGDQYKTYTYEPVPVGTVGILPDGRRFKFALAGVTALTVGKLMQAPVPIADHVLQTVAAAAVKATSIAMTLGATAIVADQYKDGLIAVELATNTGFGYAYKIDTHPLVALSGVFTVPLAGSVGAIPIGATGVMIAGDEAVQVAIATTANSVSLIAHPCRLVVVCATALTAQPVGVTVGPIAAGAYGWLQTWGPAMVLTDTTVVVGAPVINSANTAGAVMPPPTSTSAALKPFIGRVIHVAVTTAYSLIDLQIS